MQFFSKGGCVPHWIKKSKLRALSLHRSIAAAVRLESRSRKPDPVLAPLAENLSSTSQHASSFDVLSPRPAGQFHLSVQFLLTPGGGCWRKAEEIFHICSSMLQMESNLRRLWWLLQAGWLGCKSLSQQGHWVSQRKARNSAQDQHVWAAAWSRRQQALLCLPGVTTPAREPCSGLCFSTVCAMNFRDKVHTWMLFPVKKASKNLAVLGDSFACKWSQICSSCLMLFLLQVSPLAVS